MSEDKNEDMALQATKDMVRELHGHRLALCQQMIREGRFEKAKKAQHQADAFNTVLYSLRQIKSNSGWETTAKSYAELSKAIERVSDEVSESNDNVEKGLQ